MLRNPPKSFAEILLRPFWVLLYWLYLVVFSFLALVVNVSCVLTSFLPPGGWRYAFYQGMLRIMTRGSFRLLGLLGILRIRYLGFDRIACDETSVKPVLVANHPNLLDVFLFYDRLPRITCIYKSSLQKTLIKNSMGEQIGYISNADAKRMIRTAAERVRAGEQLLVFPEGTRTDVWPLNELKSGASGIARRAQVALQAVVIHSGSNFLAKRQPIWKPPVLPIRILVEVGETFHPRDYRGSRELTEAIADYFRSQLQEERVY